MSYSLTKPCLADKDKYLDYLKEWDDTKIVPFGARLQGLSFEQWLEHTKAQESVETCVKGFVPSSLYIFKKDDEIIGALHLRHYLNDYLKFVGGHIGYGIRASERGKGYAKKMLSLGLQECKKMGINQVLITADDDNPASFRTIESCGGILENKVLDQGHEVLRYWITL